MKGNKGIRRSGSQYYTCAFKATHDAYIIDITVRCFYRVCSFLFFSGRKSFDRAVRSVRSFLSTQGAKVEGASVLWFPSVHCAKKKWKDKKLLEELFFKRFFGIVHDSSTTPEMHLSLYFFRLVTAFQASSVHILFWHPLWNDSSRYTSSGQSKRSSVNPAPNESRRSFFKNAERASTFLVLSFNCI